MGCVIMVAIAEPIEVNVWRVENSLHCRVPLNNMDFKLLSLNWQNSKGEGLSSDGNVQLITGVNSNEISLTAEFETLFDGNYSCVVTVSLSRSPGVNKTVISILTVKSELKITSKLIANCLFCILIKECAV